MSRHTDRIQLNWHDHEAQRAAAPEQTPTGVRESNRRYVDLEMKHSPD